MLQFVTKSHYWKLLDSGVEETLAKANFPWHLKSVQDLVAVDLLRNCSQQKVAEIGGGDSRILPKLAAHNECVNIEKFEGRDGGPEGEIEIDGVRNVPAFMGEFSKQLSDGYFDYVFSVSVVEHVTNMELPNFIADCRRILKPGGQMLHLVDMYLHETRLDYNKQRVELYLSAFDEGLFRPLADLAVDGTRDLDFDSSFCTNPDNMMYVWNRVAPNLRGLREVSQSVSLAWCGVAI